MHRTSTKNKEILAALQVNYPKDFPANEIKLLKVAIHSDIKKEAKLEVSNKEVSRFFYWYCNTKDYVALHLENAPRYDLQGEKMGLVTSEQIEAKNKEIAKIKERIRKIIKSKNDTTEKTLLESEVQQIET
jgi:sRNA-binding protein